MGYEIDFLPVGDSNGDAICIRYGSEAQGYQIHVVDGGYSDTGQTIIDHINTYFGAPKFIDNVVLSHADNDHVTGLLKVVEHFQVGTLWMNRPWQFSAEIIDSFHGSFTVSGLEKAIRDAYPRLVELEAIATRKGIPVRDAFAHDMIGPFLVLAPTRDRYLQLISEFGRTPESYAVPNKNALRQIFDRAKAALTSFIESWGNELLSENPPPVTAANESCVVQIARFDDRTVLLTADVGPQGLNEAASVAEQYGLLRPPTFVQVPHHGSRRNVTPSVLDRWLGRAIEEGSATARGTAFCSVGKNKPEYPRRRVRNAFIRRGYPVHSTRDVMKTHFVGMPSKPGLVASTPEPFETHYDE